MGRSLRKHKEFLRSSGSFQRNTLVQYNPKSTTSSKLIIPPVLVRDEIRTDSFGMTIIELLCLTVILIEIKKNMTTHIGQCVISMSKRGFISIQMVFLQTDFVAFKNYSLSQRNLFSKLQSSYAIQKGIVVCGGSEQGIACSLSRVAVCCNY